VFRNELIEIPALMYDSPQSNNTSQGPLEPLPWSLRGPPCLFPTTPIFLFKWGSSNPILLFFFLSGCFDFHLLTMRRSYVKRVSPDR
jgi:hypothetical protein